MSKFISHKGRILSINNGLAEILIEQHSACSACHAKSLCSQSDKKEKKIYVPIKKQDYTVGNEVTICASTSASLKAVIMAFGIPLFIFLICIPTAHLLFHWSDIVSVGSSFACIGIYFVLLKINSTKLQKEFQFWLQ